MSKKAEMGLALEAGAVLCWKKHAPSQSSTSGKALSTALEIASAPSRTVFTGWTAP